MSTLLASIIRTYVPIIVGQVVSWLALANIQLDDASQVGLSTFLGGLISAAYYALARLLEEKWPAFGALLGVAKSPDGYSKGQPTLSDGSPKPAPSNEAQTEIWDATGETPSDEPL